jgi:hypothetical protein
LIRTTTERSPNQNCSRSSRESSHTNEPDRFYIKPSLISFSAIRFINMPSRYSLRKGLQAYIAIM